MWVAVVMRLPPLTLREGDRAVLGRGCVRERSRLVCETSAGPAGKIRVFEVVVRSREPNQDRDRDQSAALLADIRRPNTTRSTLRPRPSGSGLLARPPLPAPSRCCRSSPSTASRRPGSSARSPTGAGAGRCQRILVSQGPSFVVVGLLWSARVSQHSVLPGERRSPSLSPSAPPPRRSPPPPPDPVRPTRPGHAGAATRSFIAAPPGRSVTTCGC